MITKKELGIYINLYFLSGILFGIGGTIFVMTNFRNTSFSYIPIIIIFSAIIIMAITNTYLIRKINELYSVLPGKKNTLFNPDRRIKIFSKSWWIIVIISLVMIISGIFLISSIF